MTSAFFTGRDSSCLSISILTLCCINQSVPNTKKSSFLSMTTKLIGNLYPAIMIGACDTFPLVSCLLPSAVTTNWLVFASGSIPHFSNRLVLTTEHVAPVSTTAQQ
ncbi:hypothetical protein AYI69_g4431 [Smittium culicis]|uniref:Uncharacterized protein n=1 Tax=Smittium culicis TaxID=133412 RepID=A0A1R1YDR2_9FUNG|nr:hypothetical protein AYI69_g4431 [Smittium culicis]